MRETVELWVGVFILIGLICVGYLAVRLGQMEFLGGEYYYLDARFQSVSGLKKGASVEISGVPVGQVAEITLDPKDQMAVVRFKIRNDVPVTDDVIASIKTAGLIGDKFVKLSPGGSDLVLKSGERIVETESAVDLEDLISKYVFGGV